MKPASVAVRLSKAFRRHGQALAPNASVPASGGCTRAHALRLPQPPAFPLTTAGPRPCACSPRPVGRAVGPGDVTASLTSPLGQDVAPGQMCPSSSL